MATKKRKSAKRRTTRRTVRRSRGLGDVAPAAKPAKHGLSKKQKIILAGGGLLGLGGLAFLFLRSKGSAAATATAAAAKASAVAAVVPPTATTVSTAQSALKAATTTLAQATTAAQTSAVTGATVTGAATAGSLLGAGSLVQPIFTQSQIDAALANANAQTPLQQAVANADIHVSLPPNATVAQKAKALGF